MKLIFSMIVIFSTLLNFTSVYSLEKVDKVKPGTISFLDYKNGFREIHFGDNIKKFKTNFNCFKSAKFKYICTDKSIKSLLGMTIYKINYYFYKQQVARMKRSVIREKPAFRAVNV